MDFMNNMRKVDSLGRIVIPKTIRDDFSINHKDEMEICTDNDFIVISKRVSTCSICGGKKELIQYKNKEICKECISYIKKSMI